VAWTDAQQSSNTNAGKTEHIARLEEYPVNHMSLCRSAERRVVEPSFSELVIR